MESVVFYTASLCKGGAERVIVNLAEEFARRDIKVTVVTCERADVEYRLSSYIDRVVIKEIGPNKKLPKILWIRKCVRQLRKICKNVKADYLISFLSINHAIAATRFSKTKCIISIRNDPGSTYTSLLSKMFARVYLPLAEGCVFQTNDAKKWFPKRLQKKSTIIYNPIRNEFFASEYKPVDNLVITCGRLEKQKNQLVLIKAIELLAKENPKIMLNIYGQGSCLGELQQYVTDKKLNHNVFFMGVTENVPEAISKAALFAMSSDFEGMPNALMEAMAIGIPCVSTDCPCGGPRELLEDNCGALSQVGNYKDLSEKISFLLNNKEDALVMAKNAKNKALNYTQKTIADAWLSYLRSL